MEVRYYEPALWEVSERTAWWFLKNDQFGAVLAILTLGSWELLRDFKWSVFLGFALMLGSEIVMYVPHLNGPTRIFWRTLLHVGWHFLSLGYVASISVGQYAKEERLYEWFIRKMLGIVD